MSLEEELDARREEEGVGELLEGREDPLLAVPPREKDLELEAATRRLKC